MKNRGANQWMARHTRDPFVGAAKARGLRARSAFKLEQIDAQRGLIKSGMVVVDLGAAPGGWSQYAAEKIGARGQIIAVDIRAMQPLANVRCIRGDFTDESVVAEIMRALESRPADLVLSDLAPNLSGVRSADQARAERLQCAVVAFCRIALRPGGNLLTKLFAGESEQASRAQIGECFARLRALKPPASRAQSREFYLLARGFQQRAARV